MSAAFVRYAGPAIALVLLSGCGNASAVAPAAGASDGYIGTSAIPVPGAHRRMRAQVAYPIVVPETIPDSKYYEYIINDYGTYAGIFDYPKGDAMIGRIKDVGGQGCTNKLYGYGNKTFWIVAGADQISLYAAPNTLIRSLSDSIGAPSSCGMNLQGDLAVGILYGTDGGDVIVFKDAMGKGKQYKTPLSREYFDGYDPTGNLFADGFNSSYEFELTELLKGGRKFVPVTTSNTVEFPGSVQWDGKYLDVTDQGTEEIYRYTEKGTKLTLHDTILLSGSSDCAQTWIATDVVYCADAGTNVGYVFKYPAGGSPIATFTGRFALPLGTVAVGR
jgi:hypothetical protein